MKRTTITTLVLTLAVGGLAVAAPAAKKPADKKDAPAAAPADAKAGGADVNAIVAAMAKFAEPAENHARLKGMEGSFDTSLTVYLNGKAQPAEKGYAELWLMLGGRFLAEDYKGSFLGKPVSSHILFGYDNARKVYTSVRVTNLNTDMMVREGTVDATGKIITLKGTGFDPLTGKTATGRMVYTLDSADKFSVEVFETKEGQPEAKLFDVSYTRRKE